MTITPVNDAPTIQLTAAGPNVSYTATYVEDASGIKIADGITLDIDDSDNNLMQQLQVRILNLPDGGSELLIADTVGTNITASYTGGMLTLTGADSISNYEQVLRTVEYRNTSQNPSAQTRVIEVSVHDGHLQSNIARSEITLLPVNDAPIAIGDLHRIPSRWTHPEYWRTNSITRMTHSQWSC